VRRDNVQESRLQRPVVARPPSNDLSVSIPNFLKRDYDFLLSAAKAEAVKSKAYGRSWPGAVLGIAIIDLSGRAWVNGRRAPKQTREHPKTIRNPR
jgi:hypothetical protein